MLGTSEARKLQLGQTNGRKVGKSHKLEEEGARGILEIKKKISIFIFMYTTDHNTVEPKEERQEQPVHNI